MLVGKRSGGGGGGGSMNLRRTSSMRGINTELSSNTQTLEEPTIVIHTTPHFLTSCRLCRRPLSAGRDIYMYRGDTAFCSLECREEQMKQDERNYQWNKPNASNKQQDPPPPSSSAAAAAAKTHTLAAA